MTRFLSDERTTSVCSRLLQGARTNRLPPTLQALLPAVELTKVRGPLRCHLHTLPAASVFEAGTKQQTGFNQPCVQAVDLFVSTKEMLMFSVRRNALKVWYADGGQRPSRVNREENATLHGRGCFTQRPNRRLVLFRQCRNVKMVAGRFNEFKMIHGGVVFIVDHAQFSKVVHGTDFADQ